MKKLVFLLALLCVTNTEAKNITTKNIKDYYLEMSSDMTNDYPEDRKAVLKSYPNDIKNGYLSTPTEEFMLFHKKDGTPILFACSSISDGIVYSAYILEDGTWVDNKKHLFPEITDEYLVKKMNEKGITINAEEYDRYAESPVIIRLTAPNKTIDFVAYFSDIKPTKLFSVVFENDKFQIKN